MCDCIRQTYIRDEKTGFLTTMDIHLIANKNGLMLADVEAKSLLKILKQKNSLALFPTSEVENLIIELCYEQGFGRLLSYDEEEGLDTTPNEVLIDD
jgi:hypothetical protein